MHNGVTVPGGTIVVLHCRYRSISAVSTAETIDVIVGCLLSTRDMGIVVRLSAPVMETATIVEIIIAGIPTMTGIAAGVTGTADVVFNGSFEVKFPWVEET